VQRQRALTVRAVASTLRHRGLVLRVLDRAITVIVLWLADDCRRADRARPTSAATTDAIKRRLAAR
jgi:hypothetical protein